MGTFRIWLWYGYGFCKYGNGYGYDLVVVWFLQVW